MGEFREDHLLKRGGLLSDCSSNHRVGMAVKRDPPAADRINQWWSFSSIEQGPFTAYHLLQSRRGGDRREGWPEVGVMVP